MHQNLAVILQQFNYSKNSFIVLVPAAFGQKHSFKVTKIVKNDLIVPSFIFNNPLCPSLSLSLCFQYSLLYVFSFYLPLSYPQLPPFPLCLFPLFMTLSLTSILLSLTLNYHLSHCVFFLYLCLFLSFSCLLLSLSLSTQSFLSLSNFRCILIHDSCHFPSCNVFCCLLSLFLCRHIDIDRSSQFCVHDVHCLVSFSHVACVSL